MPEMKQEMKMNGIFIVPAGNGYEVTRVDDDGTFPMDWYRHRSEAERYAVRMQLQFKDLPVFFQLNGVV
jgi:hypothetical protein